ncbi:Sdh7 [Kluyveromyces lactis]|nr:Sdh7 [Kluyveromyces lactis]
MQVNHLLRQAVKQTTRAGRPGSRKPHKPLLPPLQLYRRILREHRNLPTMQRELGDQYVKNEFKLHKSTDNPLYIVGFLASWQDYLHMITRGEWEEGTLSTDLLEKMSPEQVTQLYELMKEAEQLKSGGE